MTPRPTLLQSIEGMKLELKGRLDQLHAQGRLLEAQRLEQRTLFDLEMLEATGSCAGIENYSRYLTGRRPGEPPPTLFEYLPDNALVFTDESHVTIPQIGGMYRGDYRRKATWPNTASACRHAWTIGRSGSRNGRRCGPRPCMSRRRPDNGRWSRRTASSSSR